MKAFSIRKRADWFDFVVVFIRYQRGGGWNWIKCHVFYSAFKKGKKIIILKADHLQWSQHPTAAIVCTFWATNCKDITDPDGKRSEKDNK